MKNSNSRAVLFALLFVALFLSPFISRAADFRREVVYQIRYELGAGVIPISTLDVTFENNEL